MSDLTQQGISAFNSGDKELACRLFRLALVENPLNIQAWLWLSGAVETDQERLECLQAIIKLDPEHTLASKGIARLVADGKLDLQVKPAEDTPVPGEAVQILAVPIPSELPSPESEAIPPLFEIRPSFSPFVISFGLTLIILGLVGRLAVVAMGDNNTLLILWWGLFCLIWIWAFVQLFFALIRALATRYTLTTQYLIVQSGLFSRTKKTIPVTEIQEVSVHQPFLLSPFDVGDVVIVSAGEERPIKLRALAQYKHRSDQIRKLTPFSHS